MNTNPLKGDMARRAIGRSRVRTTWGSRSLSHKSLIVHPAPRMINAPEKNNKDVLTTDPTEATGAAIGAAIKVEKRQGKNR